VRSKNILMH